tara:strand:+ start:8959 stop:10539 length:1581 start_codon:yes stop_codon:yes gene_type:complete
MAIIQPFFQPDVTPETPLFATFLNGFMERRTRDNLTIMSKFLDNQDSKFINDHIKLLQTNRQELIKLKAEIQGKEAEFGQQMALELMKKQADVSIQRQRSGTEELKIAGNILTAHTRALKNVSESIKTLKNDKRQLRVALNNPQAFNDIIEGIEKLEGGQPAVTQLIKKVNNNTMLNEDPNAFKNPDRMPFNVAVLFQSIVDDDLKKLKANKAYLTTTAGKQTLKQALNIVGTEVKNFDKLQPQDLLNLSREAFTKEIRDTTDAFFTRRKQLDDVNLAAKLSYVAPAATILQLQDDKARLEKELKFLDTGKGAVAKSKEITSKLDKIDLEIDKTKVRIPKQAYASASAAKNILRKFPKLAKSKNIATDLQAEINMLGEQISANKLYRQQISKDIIKQGPSRMFKGFRKNYLLETPFKRESKKGKRIRETLDFMAKEKITKTGAGNKSKYFQGLEYGKAYTPSGTPGLQVGIAKAGKNERPFMVKQTGEYHYVDENESEYDQLLTVLGNINRSMYVPKPKKKSKKRK